MKTKIMQTDARAGFYKPSQAQKYFGITRSVLTYWVDKLELVKPAQELPGLDLFDFVNLLNLGIVKTLTMTGFKASELRATMNLANQILGRDWKPVRDIISKRIAEKSYTIIPAYPYIGLEIGMSWKAQTSTLRISIEDDDRSVFLSGTTTMPMPKGKAVFMGRAIVSVPLNMILVQTTVSTKDYSWWPPGSFPNKLGKTRGTAAGVPVEFKPREQLV